MIKFAQRFDEYAYRVSDENLDDSVTTLEEGQWVAFNSSGNLVVATDSKTKAFLVIASKRTGRNQMTTAVKKATFLHGAFRLETDQFDPAKTYTTGAALKVAAGVLTPWISGTDGAQEIVAYTKGAPVDGYLKIFTV